MRALGRAAALVVLGFALLVVTAGGASAHPLGNFTINTYDGIVVTPNEVRVQYVLDMAEIPTFQLGRTLDSNGDGDRTAAELAAFARAEATTIVADVHVTANGRPVSLAVRSASASLRPGQAGLQTLRLEALFAGPIPGSGSLALSDETYADHVGWHEVTAVGAEGATLTASDVPTKSVSDELLRYPQRLLASPLHVTTAHLEFEPGTSGAAPGAPGAGGEQGSQDEARPGVTGGAFAKLATWTGLSLPALLLALLLAAAFGAAHALLPGHGKTLIAAYLVGQGGRLTQAAQVGAAVAFMHSASVLALGLAILGLQVVAPDRIYPWVTLATGVLVVAMGAALAVTRVREARRGTAGHGHHHSHSHGHEHVHLERQAEAVAPAMARMPALAGVGASRGGPALFAPSLDEPGHMPDAPAGGIGQALGADHDSDAHHSDAHDHGPDGHDHGSNGHHDHGSNADASARPDLDRPLSRKGLSGLAVAGGILPSPTAIVVLLATFSAHRMGFGLALIVSFSLGMAGALVGVGFVALRARSAVSRRLSGRLLWALPVATAIVIAGVGIYLTAKGIAGI